MTTYKYRKVFSKSEVLTIFVIQLTDLSGKNDREVSVRGALYTVSERDVVVSAYDNSGGSSVYVYVLKRHIRAEIEVFCHEVELGTLISVIYAVVYARNRYFTVISVIIRAHLQDAKEPHNVMHKRKGAVYELQNTEDRPISAALRG